MKKIMMLGILLVVLAASVSAHQRALVGVEGKDYLILIGSIGEPVYVNDKSGVDLGVYVPDANDPMSTSAGTPVEGIEETLEVQLIYGDHTKTLPFSTQFGQPGRYKAVYYPAKSGEYQYRLFGTINGGGIDKTFTCSSEGHVMNADAVEDPRSAGKFGCIQDKDEVTFPAHSKKGHKRYGHHFLGKKLVVGLVVLGALVLILRKKKRK